MSPQQSRYWRGKLLYSICEYLQIPKEQYETASPLIHEALKKTFDVGSFKDLSVAEFEKIAATTRMLFIREFGGWMIPEPDEKFDPNSLTLSEFLKLKNP